MLVAKEPSNKRDVVVVVAVVEPREAAAVAVELSEANARLVSQATTLENFSKRA